MFFGSRVGGMLSVPLALPLINRWGWRASFVIVGAIGLVWSAAWFVWYRDRPSEHPSVSVERARVDRAGQIGGTNSGRQAGGREADIATPWKALLHSRNLYAILRDVIHLRVRSLLLLHVAPDVPDPGAGILTAERRAARRVAVSLRRPRQPGRRLAHRCPRARPWPAHRPLRAWMQRVSCRRRAHLRVDARAAADCESGVARPGARIGRSRARRLLGRVPRHRPRSRWRRHRLHEHVFQPWRRADAARGRVCGRSLAVVDVPVLRDRSCVCRRRADLADDRPRSSHCRADGWRTLQGRGQRAEGKGQRAS